MSKIIHPAILKRARELRQPLTPPEALLWNKLRRKQVYGFKFRRQHPIYRFILDFYCVQCKLAVEVDGDSHFTLSQQLYDQARTNWLNQHGIAVIRFTNSEVFTNMEGVLVEIAQCCMERNNNVAKDKD